MEKSGVVRYVVPGAVLLAAVGMYFVFQSPATDTAAVPTPSPAVVAPEPAPAEVEPSEAPEPSPAAEDVPDEPSGLLDDLTEPYAVLSPVDFDQVADYGNDVAAEIVDLAVVDGQARGPGERAGRAVAAEIQLTNDSDTPLSLDYLVVDLYSTSGALGVELMSDPRHAPIAGLLLPGESATGTYVLRLPDSSNEITLTVSYEAQTAAVAFHGEVQT